MCVYALTPWHTRCMYGTQGVETWDETSREPKDSSGISGYHHGISDTRHFEVIKAIVVIMFGISFKYACPKSWYHWQSPTCLSLVVRIWYCSPLRQLIFWSEKSYTHCFWRPTVTIMTPSSNLFFFWVFVNYRAYDQNSEVLLMSRHKQL